MTAQSSQLFPAELRQMTQLIFGFMISQAIAVAAKLRHSRPSEGTARDRRGVGKRLEGSRAFAESITPDAHKRRHFRRRYKPQIPADTAQRAFAQRPSQFG